MNCHCVIFLVVLIISPLSYSLYSVYCLYSSVYRWQLGTESVEGEQVPTRTGIRVCTDANAERSLQPSHKSPHLQEITKES